MTSLRLPVGPTVDDPLSHTDANALLDCQNQVLELIATQAPLPALLDTITTSLERLIDGSACSVLLLDEAGALRHGSAPSLPPDYSAAIDGLLPGPDVGSCGSAAHLGRAVVVEDIATDVRWAPYRELALGSGLAACWSTPIFGTAAAVVGTFAVYHSVPHRPGEREERVVARLSYLASVAIAHAALYRQLSVSEERFRRAFEDNAVAMSLVDAEGRFLRVNRALLRLTGLTRSAAAGTTLLDVVTPDDRDVARTALAHVRSGRDRAANVELRVVRPDASMAVVSMTASLVRGAGDEPGQVCVNLLDITARIAARAERAARRNAELARAAAESASRAKSDFLAAVSHEMRTPLQAITGFAEILGTLELDGHRRAEALRHITEGAQHLMALVDDTLDLSRIEARALPLAAEVVVLADLVTDVLDFLAPVARDRVVVVHRGTVEGSVRADGRRLRQVLINLVSNAIRYSGADGQVHVSAGRDGGGASVRIADNGPGIPESVRARLFEPFTVGSASDPAGGGFGLGLMLAHGLTEAMGGTLTVDNTDAGAVAHVRLSAP